MRKFLAAALAFSFCAAAPATAAEGPKKVRDGLYENELVRVDTLARLRRSPHPPLVLDARSKKSHDASRIAGSRLPRSTAYYEIEELFRQGVVPKSGDPARGLEEGMRDVPRDRSIVTYCGSGCAASAVLLFDLKRLGFTDVKVLDEGFEAWRDKGHPVEEGPAGPPDGENNP